MQKDVIYIDTEDDITAIIGKVKAAKAKIVALVPPKRIGAIQSAVNLKLVHRAAEQADKRLVLISNNAALMALAGSAGIPVAKNLQSKPELAEIPALEVDDGEDIIDGDALSPTVKDDAVEAVLATEGVEKTAASSPKAALGAAAVAAKSKVKIPNFNSFRKKLLLIILAAVVLIGGLVWAFVFAPRATIIVQARTSDIALNTQVKLSDAGTTSLKEGIVRIVTKSSKKDVSVPFTATGKKDVGEKATGTVRFKISNPAIYATGATIPAGTKVVASSGASFSTNSAVSFDSDESGSVLAAGKTVAVTADASGTSSNGANGSASGPSGFTTAFTVATSGGTDKTVTVVEQGDIDNVSEQVLTNSESDAAKQALAKEFGNEYVVLDGSFKANKDEVKPSPAVGAEAADGKGVLAGSVTYTLSAVPKGEMSKFLSEYFAQAIDGKTSQKIYNDGIKTVSFTNVNAVEGGYTAGVTTNGKVGPKVDENALKEFANGKKTGEIQDYARNVNGVENVEVKLSPFWVTSVPGDTKKISVEFKVNE